ncbi:MAG: A alpha-helical domain with a conserved ER moti [Devosia sp. 63-57]|nr:MAG: A alpha-helical domain with a conserved ER moti [Pelagibacterium sp. SCN 63-126]ODU88301.1 MAG: A alpha-helical domain with a conserved ER moti [Pelagibacterium sp. SCN 63-17]OJX42651.1 MAG: A alpha-helical domain with a conserved ER moti [Devosia sp. 63-57]
MLGRTAQNLFWLSRYVERAENMARLLEVGYRMSLTSRREGGSSEHLISMMQAAEVDEGFSAKYEIADVDSVAHYMMFDPDNSSSVYSCLEAARTNARSVRTAITTDMWESMNGAWLEYSQIKPRDVRGAKLLGLLQWVKQRSHEFRGALLGTILRDDGFAFLQAGNFVERADNTARILDMKYYVLLPRSTLVGGEIDIQQWTLILRAASAHRAYRHVYHDRYKAHNITDFLILRPEMPRSLIFCARFVQQNLDMLSEFYGRKECCHDAAADLLAMVEDTNMETIFTHGLHEFLNEFISRNNRVTDALSKSYNFY